MDGVRRLSYLLMVLTIIVAIILLCLKLWSETIVTVYCILSISLLLYCISKQIPSTQQNKILYEIMRCSKKVKRMMYNNNLKYANGITEKAIYINDDESEPKQNKNGKTLVERAKMMGKIASASLFFDLQTADAKVQCCRPFYLKYTNYMKVDRYDGEYERMVITNDWYSPGPLSETIYINGSQICTFDLYCMNTYYKGLMDSLWYVIGIILLYTITKSILFTYNILKTPVSTYTTEEHIKVNPDYNIELGDMSGIKNNNKTLDGKDVKKSVGFNLFNNDNIRKDNNRVYNSTTTKEVSDVKIIRTNYKYCNMYRTLFIILYLTTFSTTMIWIFNIVSITPVQGLFVNNESKITIYNETVDYYTYIDFLNTPDDLVGLNETNYEDLIKKHYRNTHYQNGTIKIPTNDEPGTTETTITSTEETTNTNSNNRRKRNIYEVLDFNLKYNQLYNMSGNSTALSNLTCYYDVKAYLLNGIVDADCIYNSSNWGVLLFKKNNDYKRIDSRCYEQLNIDQSRLGNPVCYEHCSAKKLKNGRKINYCEIRYDPNIVKSKSINDRPIVKNLREMNNIKLLLSDEASRTDRITVTYNGIGRRSTAIQNSITRYGVGTYIFEDWRTQFSNANGAIFLAEFDNNDAACLAKEPNRGTYQAVCSHKKRQMISCEPNLWGTYSIDSNTFDCVVPTTQQLNVMPNWRKVGINIPYSIPQESLAGDIPLYKETRTVPFRTQSNVILNLELNLELIWGKTYQDNIQQQGGMKYFIYSALFKVTQDTQIGSQSSFPTAYNSFLDYYNRWESRSFSNDYHMDRFTLASGNRLIPDILMNVAYLEPPSENNMRQDRAYINFVFKSDIYNSVGQIVNPLINGWDSADPCLRGTSNVPCTWLVPVYYAIRVYGPALIDIKFFGKTLETIAFNNDVCSSVNAVKKGGICYMIDHDTVSTDMIVGGYPWTNWSAMFTSEWNAVPEFPSFYLNHPKTGSGQYMAQVSDAANIGFFSQDGKCTDTYYEDGVLMCDGNAAVNIRMVEYTTFHRPLLSMPNCRIHNNNTLDCLFSDPTLVSTCSLDPYGLKIDKDCNTNITTRYMKNINEAEGYNIKTPVTGYQIQRGYDTCLTGDCTGTYFIETSHRCLFCVILIMMVAGIGYVALAIHLILCIVCYINSYTLGRLGRMLKMNFLFDWGTTPTCNFCGMYMYNNTEKAKHDSLCPVNRCPFCVTINPNNELCVLSFPNKTNFKLHMNIHKTIRRNPYIGYIRARRNKVVTFTLLVLFSLNNVNYANSQYFPLDTGMRSNKVGSNITVPSENIHCNSKGCKIITNYRATVPLTDGSEVVLNTNIDGTKYSKKITIENPHIDTSCTYLYSSPRMVVGNRRLVYTCLGKTTCNYDNLDSMLLNPIAGRKGNVFTPMDPYNPLKSYYCPKAVSCQSPIVDFMWLTAGCWTIDDGTAIGYEYYLPNVKDVMIHVFRCTVNDIDYKICEGSLCKHIDGASSDIEDGDVHFEHITNNLPVQFTVGVTAKQGEDKPNHIYYNVPDNTMNTDNTAFAMKINRIPQGETCVEGTNYFGGSCEIDTAGASPALNCNHFNPNVDDKVLIDNYQSLADVYHCNFEQTMLNWNTEILSRSVSVDGTLFEDTQTVSWPSLDLNSTNCNFGFIEIDMITMESVTMEQVRYEGEIKSVRCEGWYNRNNKARLTFELNGHNGMFETHCPGVFSETCLFDSNKVNYCNVTILLPTNSSCEYNGGVYYLNCDSLMGYVPDPASGGSIGWTGSEDYNTWLSGFTLALGKWWNITLITIGSILLLIFLLWICISCCRCYKDAGASSYYTKKRDIEYIDSQDMLVDSQIYRKINNENGNMTQRKSRMVFT